MPISCESQYIIDSLFELLEITPDEYDYIWDSQLDIDRLVDDNIPVRETIHQVFDQDYPTLSSVEKASLGFTLLLNSNRQIEEFFKYIADKTVESYYRGQGKRLAGISRLIGTNGKTDFTVTDCFDLNQVQQIVEDIDIFPTFSNRFHKALTRSLKAVSQVNFEEYTCYKREKLYLRQLAIEQLKMDRDTLMERLDPKALQARKRNIRKQQKQGQKVLKKSLNILQSFLGASQVAAFIHGDKITITGKKFKFIIQKSHVNLVNQSAAPASVHIPYDMTLTDANDVVLGQMCLLFRDTPVLDQILAVHLHVLNGQEEKLLETANFFSTTKEYSKNSDIRRIKRLDEVKKKIDLLRPITNFETIETNTYFALRDEVYEFLLKKNCQSLIGLSQQQVDFLLHPPYQPDEILTMENFNLANLLEMQNE